MVLSKNNLLLTGFAVSFCLTQTATAMEPFSPSVDDRGNITLPQDFRKNMVHLGSWFVPEGGASGFHDVYSQPETVEAYRKTGKFPDGAILIKELRVHESADYTTGKGVSYSTAGIKQTFVMIKDSQGRFEGKSWGDGWGWALFKTGQPGINASSDYKKDCLGCHVPAQANDWVYSEGYPTLTNP